MAEDKRPTTVEEVLAKYNIRMADSPTGKRIPHIKHKETTCEHHNSSTAKQSTPSPDSSDSPTAA